MNDLTGAFLIARSKGENLLLTRQSLANAGYPITEIEQALMEANQIFQDNISPIKPEVKEKSYKLPIFISTGAFLIILGILIFIFWKDIISLLGRTGV
jgi:hypothetical protein